MKDWTPDQLRRRREQSQRYAAKHRSRLLWLYAKKRAADKGLEFTISVEDIVIPTRCPALGIELSNGGRGLTDFSPTLDRVDNERGYVRGNIVVVSNKANAMKRNASVAEMRRVLEFYEGQLVPQ